MKLSELAEELARRENDAEQVLKIADIELKSGTIGLWSGGVLTAIQLYFLLNLSAFSKRIQKGDEALDFPWIVLYRTRISFTFAALTLCIGPALLGGFFLPRLALANCEDHVFYCGFIEMGFAIVNLVIASVTMVKLWANFKPFPTQKR